MKSNEFVTSDHHFGHSKIIQYSNRPFKNKDEMNEAMIRSWNAKIPKGSIVYHLGDFGFISPSDFIKIINRLNGTIRLVSGNHDGATKHQEVKKLFDWIKPYYESKTDDGIQVVMSHYPFLEWNKSYYGSWHLHGHSHGRLPVSSVRRMDVGVDTNKDFSPYSFYEVKSFMESRGKND
jgi:calcineurin-like phosphoesterase family protein